MNEIEPFTVTGINGGKVKLGFVKHGVNHLYIRLDAMSLSDPARARALIDWLIRAVYGENMVVVPKEPTKEMLDAGYHQGFKTAEETGELTMLCVYRAMISAGAPRD